MGAWVALCVLVAACSAPAKDSVAELEDPATCARCHSRHYAEWSGSMHAYATDDPVFLAMNRRGQRDTSNLLGTFCLQCHAPMAIALGLADGQDFDPKTLPAAARGVTCYFCHNVDKVTSDHDNGLHLAFDDTMRGGVDDPTDSPAHHSRFDPALMASATNGSTMCGSCHDVVTQRGVALERTYREWKTTVFATQGEGATCSTCHMTTNVDPPTTLIADGQGLDVKSRANSFHEHLWPAIDQAYAPFAGVQAATAQATAIHRDLDPALAIVGPPTSSTGGICVTADGNLSVRLETRNIGHAWPSGAAHDRRAWLEVIAYDAANNILFSSGVVPDGVDPEAIADPNLFALWDRTFAEDSSPAHFFWDVVTVQSQVVSPPIDVDPNSHSMTATFDLGLAIAGAVDHISARVRIRPFSHVALDELVASGDLEPAIGANLLALDPEGAHRTWTRTDLDPASDGCDHETAR